MSVFDGLENIGQQRADAIKARRAAEAVAVSVPAVGDTVTIGRGDKHWTIESFWGDGLARLAQNDGYSHTSVHITSLHVVAKAGAS